MPSIKFEVSITYNSIATDIIMEEKIWLPDDDDANSHEYNS